MRTSYDPPVPHRASVPAGTSAIQRRLEVNIDTRRELSWPLFWRPLFWRPLSWHPRLAPCPGQPLLADLPEVSLEVHLDGSGGRSHVPPGCGCAIPGYLAVHLGLRRQDRLAFEQVGHPM